jgi:hypothetical protein
VFAAPLGETKQHLSDLERAAAWAKVLGYDAGQFVELAVQAQLREARLPFIVTLTSAPRRQMRRPSARRRVALDARLDR